jgi:sulfur carrier protein ThiS
MQVRVKLYGSLRRLSNEKTPGMWQGDLPPGSLIRDLIATLGTGETEVAAAAIHGEICPFDQEIQDGMVISLVTHVGGG